MFFFFAHVVVTFLALIINNTSQKIITCMYFSQMIQLNYSNYKEHNKL